MKLIFSILMLLVSIAGHAEIACPNPLSINEILECLKNKHQIIQLKELEVKATGELGQALSQRPNPVVDVQTVHARGAKQTQIVISQELDLSGKRKSLRKKGELIHETKKNELKISTEQVVEEVLLAIQRLIYLDETLEVNREVSRSFRNVIAALKKRPALTPEQEASLLNFRLQQSEVNNIISLLEDEEEEIILFFFLNGGYPKEEIRKVVKGQIGPLELKREIANNLSLNLQRIGLETKLAKEELNFQNSLLWEGVSIGPMFMNDNMEYRSEKLYGVSLSFPVPVWQTNKAGKAIASVGLENTITQFDLLKRREDLQRNSLRFRINALKLTLMKLPSNDELFKTHKRIEKLYSQGLITPTSFLESHRIWRDVTSSKLELKEKILRQSIEYHRLSGVLSEVKL